jgi:membrane protease YdiL (CAAX protease family)
MALHPSPRHQPEAPTNTAQPLTQRRALNERRALIELALGYGVILLVIWTPAPWQRPLYLVAVLVVAALLWAGFTSAPAMGLRATNFLRSLWIVAVALAISAICIATARHFQTLHPVHGPIAFLKRYWGYALWSFVQQLLLQDFFLSRLRRLIPSAHLAALAAAAIFAIAHLPNPILTSVTFIMGLAACLLFLHYRNLYPLAIAHAILGITIAITLPSAVIRNMRVGLGYLTFPKHHLHHRNHSDHVVSTSAWVSADAPTRRS